MNRDTIVVTGIGLVTPLGTGAPSVWRAFRALESGIRDATKGEAGGGSRPGAAPPAVRAGYVRGFNPRELIQAPQLRRMDWCSRMLVAATRQAFDDAGLLPLPESLKEEAALVVGSCYGNQGETEQFLARAFTAGAASAQPFLFPNLVLNAAGGYAAIELDLQGPNLTVAEHEASGEAALATAIDLLRGGLATVACAGGFDEFGSVLLDALKDRRILHPQAMERAARARAQASRRGLEGAVIPGEGAAMLLLEPASRAMARGARIYAELECARVAGVDAGPYGFARDVDQAAARLLEIALSGAGGSDGDLGPAGRPDDKDAALDGVIGGADGTVPREALDQAVLRAVASRQAESVTYACFKRLTGEWGSAGAFGAALAALALDAGVLPAIDANGRAGAPCLEPRRILVVGAARSGVIAPVVLARASLPMTAFMLPSPHLEQL